MQQAATALQAAWRGHQARNSLWQQRKAAVVMQAAYRGWRVRQAIAQSIPFIVKLQAYFRAGRQRAAFLRLRTAAVTLQAAVKGQQERQRYAWRFRAATLDSIEESHQQLTCTRHRLKQLHALYAPIMTSHTHKPFSCLSTGTRSCSRLLWCCSPCSGAGWRDVRCSSKLLLLS